MTVLLLYLGFACVVAAMLLPLGQPTRYERVEEDFDYDYD